MNNDAEQFFSELGGGYDDAIERCVPRYQEMLGALITYAPAGTEPRRILELGCGTGNLSALIVRKWPRADLTVVDVSAELLSRCQQRLESLASQAEFRCHDFRCLDLPQEHFDLTLSSIAIHHLTSEEKQRLFGEVFRSTRPGGSFSFADQFAGSTDEIYRLHMQQWRELADKAGATGNEWSQWMSHQEQHDFHEPIGRQLDWLTASGFESVDCVWRHLLWAIVVAYKPSTTRRCSDPA